MKTLALSLVLAITIGLCACPAEKGARDTAAALQGSLLAAQAKYQSFCGPNPSQTICQTITKAISAQNALVTATEAYCGWAVNPAPPDPKAKCIPVKGAQAAFETALANAKQITVEIKGAI